jgi:steroid delta-isomerase-like uncharacterized protein
MPEGQRASDRNKELMQRFYDEVVNGRNLDQIDELLRDDFVEHEHLEGRPQTRDGVKLFFGDLHAAFPDLTFTVEQILAEGNMAAAHVRIRGTHSGGEIMGIPASGRSIDFEAMDLIEFENGVATAHWGVSDAVTMMQQLGAIPEPG